tara:strand:- start:333 stop:506 length:174 start_codon:yes stop_codon:yes gene_type:complete
MSALKHNHIIREFGDRLKTQGKAGKVVIVAVMHKLLRMIFAILKSGVQFRDVATSYT